MSGAPASRRTHGVAVLWWPLMAAACLLLPAAGWAQSRATLELLPPAPEPEQGAETEAWPFPPDPYTDPFESPLADPVEEPEPPAAGDPPPGLTEPQPPVLPGEPEAPRRGYLEPAFPGQPAEGRVIVSADQVYLEDERIHATGTVTIRSVQYTLQADEAELDERQEWVRLRGNITLQGKHLLGRGQAVRANLKTGAWWLEEDAAAVVEPEFFASPEVTEPLYLRAEHAHAPREEGPLTVTRGQVTSCDLDRPHYRFAARRIEVRPQNRLLLERPSLYLGGRRLLELPFSMVLSMDERRQRYLPAVGHNEVEGYFAKFAFGYLLGEAASGVARLNLTQRRGVGLGLEQSLRNDTQQGDGSLLYEPDQGSLTGRLQHRWQLSSQWSTDLASSYQSRSGYFGDTTSLAGNLLVNRRTADGSLQLGMQRSLTSGSFGSSERTTTSLTQRQQWGAAGDWGVRAALEEFSYGPGLLPTRNLTARAEINRRAGPLDLSLLAEELFELQRPEGSLPRFSLNRVPALVVRTDSRRLGQWPLLGRTPFQAEVNVGRFRQQPDDLDVMRYATDLRVGGERRPWAGRLQSRASGRLLQAFYSDGSAQYIAAANLDLEHNLGGGWYQRLRYNHQQREGFAPIRIDYAGRQDSLSWQMVQARADRSRLDVSTGYDLVGGFWRDLRLSAEYMPSSRSKLSLQGGYDLRRSEPRPLALMWTQVQPGELYLTLGAQYDPGGQGLLRAATELEWVLNPLWQVALVSSYSGYTNRLDTLDVQLTRDLHCLTATLTYSQALDQLTFAIGIKAFPSPLDPFGLGRGGERFQTLPGQYF